MPRYDTAIIGGGPAGSAAAIMLARAGARVLLLERGRFPRHKVCGEFVSSESLAVLRTLLAPARAFDSVTQVSHTRLFIDGRVVEAALDPPAASITRYDLDFALWNAARSTGAECRDNCEVLQLAADGDCFTLHTPGETFTARVVLDATGRWSRLRDEAVPPGPKWIGLKCHFKSSSELEVPSSQATDLRTRNSALEGLGTGNWELGASVDLYFFDRGYCGVQTIAPGVLNACAMVRSDRATTLNEVFALHPALAERANHWTPMFDPISTAPLVFRDPKPVRDLEPALTAPGNLTRNVKPETRNAKPETGNLKLETAYRKPVLCVGDAAAFIDPFVGDGISLALRTGVAAADALSRFLRNEEALAVAAWRYSSRYRREFVPILRSAARVRGLLDQPRSLRVAVLMAMRLPFVANYVIRKTRTA